MALIIAVGSRKRVGKDTFANFATPIFEKADLTVLRDSFVEGARDYVQSMFPHIPDTDENKDEYRKVMVSIVKASLEIDELVFTKDLVQRVAEIPDDYVVFVPDLRRRVEYEYMRKELPDNLLTVRVDRGEYEDSFGEGDLDDDKFYDIIIDNNGSLEEMDLKSQMVAQELLSVYNGD